MDSEELQRRRESRDSTLGELRALVFYPGHRFLLDLDEKADSLLPPTIHLNDVSIFFSRFGPILFKQVPYTMAKFGAFEIAFEKIVGLTGKDKSELSPSTLTSLNLGAGVLAGLAAAFVSQPADTLLSKINKSKALPGETTTGRLIKIAGQLGVKGLFGGMTAR